MKYVKSIINIIIYFAIYLVVNQVWGLVFEISKQYQTLNQLLHNNPGIGFAITNVMSILVYVALFRIKKQNMIKYCQFNTISKQSIVWILFIGMGMAFASISLVKVAYIQNNFPQIEEVLRFITEGEYLVFVILGPVLLGAVFEDILFRGLIFNEIQKIAPVYLAVVLQAIIFGAVFMNLPMGLYAFFGAIIFGFIYVWTASIWGSILAHVFNSIFLIILRHFTIITENSATIALFIAIGIIFISMYRLKIINTSMKVPKANLV